MHFLSYRLRPTATYFPKGPRNCYRDAGASTGTSLPTVPVGQLAKTSNDTGNKALRSRNYGRRFRRYTGSPKEEFVERKSFPPGVAEQLKWYVYRLIDPRNGETFYVGKGKGDRVFEHANGVLSPTSKEDARKMFSSNRVV